MHNLGKLVAGDAKRMMTLKPVIQTCLVWMLLPAAAGWACRYTVRDIGFADLRGAQYTLLLSGSTAGASGSQFEAELPAWLGDLRQAGRSAGVRVIIQQGTHRIVNGGEEEAEQSAGRLPPQSAGAIDEPPPVDGVLPAAVPPRLSSEPTAAPGTAILIDRQGRRLTIRLWSSHTREQMTDENRVQALMQQLFSPMLKQLAVQSIDSFAQILIVEGNDSKANEQARLVAAQAQAALRKVEGLLPRPVAFPVRIRQVKWEQRQDERVLLWVLGESELQEGVTAHASTEGSRAGQLPVEAQKQQKLQKPQQPPQQESQPQPPDESALTSGPTVLPRLAVIYGRGRLAGKVMVGQEIQLREVLAQLALVGESCECETDRAWFDEPTLPLPWSNEARQQAVPLLGFDPDSPLVQAEMVRIVSQGKSTREASRNDRRRPSEPASATGAGTSDASRRARGDAIERILLGYDELALDAFSKAEKANAVQDGQATADNARPGLEARSALPGTVSPAAAAASDQAPLAASAEVRAKVIQGGGWDFETPSDNVTETSQAANGASQLERAPSPRRRANPGQRPGPRQERGNREQEADAVDLAMAPSAREVSASVTHASDTIDDKIGPRGKDRNNLAASLSADGLFDREPLRDRSGKHSGDHRSEPEAQSKALRPVPWRSSWYSLGATLILVVALVGVGAGWVIRRTPRR